MKIAMIIVRTLMGLLFLFASIVVLFNIMPPPPADQLPPRVAVFMEGVKATGYLLTLIKVTELVCGLAFVFGRFVPLATVVIAPVIVNIFFVPRFCRYIGPAGRDLSRPGKLVRGVLLPRELCAAAAAGNVNREMKNN